MKIYQRKDEISWNDQDYKVSWTFTPSTPDVWNLPNGDPGYPGSPQEAEIVEMIDDKNLTNLQNNNQKKSKNFCLIKLKIWMTIQIDWQ